MEGSGSTFHKAAISKTDFDFATAIFRCCTVIANPSMNDWLGILFSLHQFND